MRCLSINSQSGEGGLPARHGNGRLNGDELIMLPKDHEVSNSEVLLSTPRLSLQIHMATAQATLVGAKDYV